jgi:hypothetical protein
VLPPTTPLRLPVCAGWCDIMRAVGQIPTKPPQTSHTVPVLRQFPASPFPAQLPRKRAQRLRRRARVWGNCGKQVCSECERPTACTDDGWAVAVCSPLGGTAVTRTVGISNCPDRTDRKTCRDPGPLRRMRDPLSVSVPSSQLPDEPVSECFSRFRVTQWSQKPELGLRRGRLQTRG